MTTPKKAKVPASNIEAVYRRQRHLTWTYSCLQMIARNSPRKELSVRRTSNPVVFRAPHVLVAQGFQKIALLILMFSFRHALRGISGPKEDRDLLIFLSAYLRSSLASILSLFTLLPTGGQSAEDSRRRIAQVALSIARDDGHHQRANRKSSDKLVKLVTSAASKGSKALANRQDIVQAANTSVRF